MSDEDQYASIAEEDQYAKDEQREGKNKGPRIPQAPAFYDYYDRYYNNYQQQDPYNQDQVNRKIEKRSASSVDLGGDYEDQVFLAEEIFRGLLSQIY